MKLPALTANTPSTWKITIYTVFNSVTVVLTKITQKMTIVIKLEIIFFKAKFSK